MPRLSEHRALRLPLPPSGERSKITWCSEIKGFGCRVLSSNARSWIVRVKHGANGLQLTLGKVGTLPFEGPPDAPGARDLAVAALNAARRGEDPRLAIGRLANAHPILDDIWTAYEAAGQPKLRGVGKKRASSCDADRRRYRRLLKPTLGAEPIDQMTTERVRQFLDTIATEGERRCGLTLLKVILSYGRSRGLCEPKRIDIATTRSKGVENYLTRAELARLDGTLADLADRRPDWVFSYGAIRLLLHTGARKSEVLALRWADIDFEHRVARIRIDKTSDRGRDLLLSDPALAVLAALPRTTTWVFPGRISGRHLVDITDAWMAALAAAGLRRVRLHDLRHSFASAAISQQVSLFVVGKLLGHSRHESTARYSHLERVAQREALDRIAGVIGA